MADDTRSVLGWDIRTGTLLFNPGTKECSNRSDGLRKVVLSNETHEQCRTLCLLSSLRLQQYLYETRYREVPRDSALLKQNIYVNGNVAVWYTRHMYDWMIVNNKCFTGGAQQIHWKLCHTMPPSRGILAGSGEGGVRLPAEEWLSWRTCRRVMN